MSVARSIAQLKVTLDQVEPRVLRRLEVPLRLKLDRLHLASMSSSALWWHLARQFWQCA